MKNIQIHKIEPRSPEWYKFRLGARVGCSEIRDLLIKNDGYSDSIMLYYKKLGLKKENDIDNEAMFHGRNQEDYIAEMWQYWDGKTDTYNNKNYLNNYNSGTIIRRCRKVNGIVTNTQYPYLFGNVDRLINKNTGFNLLTGEPLEKKGALEIKTVEGWAADKWEFGINPAYVSQLMGYLMLFELDYGEVAVLKNGRFLDVFPFQRNNDIIEIINNHVSVFMEKHVIPGIEWAEKYRQAISTYDKVLEEESLAAIHEYEPEVSGMTAYEDFVKEKFKNQEISIQGNEEILTFARKDKQLAFMAGILDDVKQENKNRILQYIDHTGASRVDFGGDGFLKFFTKVNASRPQLGNHVKPTHSEVLVKKELLSLIG